MIRSIRIWFVVVSIASSTLYGEHRPLNLTIAKQRVEAYYECGQYDADMDKVINKAIKHFEKVPVTSRAAVVFDVDDTILSTFCEDKAISYGHIDELSQAFEEQGQLPVIEQTKRLYDYLVKRGFHIIFITGRRERAVPGTIKNLNNQGITTFDTIIARTPAEEGVTAQAYKTAHRAQLEREGYHIVGSVGDQWSDLSGGHAGYPVKLPNYRYLLD